MEAARQTFQSSGGHGGREGSLVEDGVLQAGRELAAAELGFGEAQRAVAEEVLRAGAEARLGAAGEGSGGDGDSGGEAGAGRCASCPLYGTPPRYLGLCRHHSVSRQGVLVRKGMPTVQ